MRNFLTALSVLFLTAVAACSIFGVAEGTQVAKDATSIFDCQNKGREAGTYKAYDDCMVEAGLRDGGK